MSMNDKNPQAFHSQFGCDPPLGLLEFLCDQSICESLPATFSIERVASKLEIQYVLNIFDPSNLRFDRNYLAFAVTTDGHDLLVPLDNINTFILQDEFGVADSLGISLQDLLLAKCSSIK